MTREKKYNLQMEAERLEAFEEAFSILKNKPIKIFGEKIIDLKAIEQLANCYGPDDYAVLTADL
jgi:hypothetical protein